MLAVSLTRSNLFAPLFCPTIDSVAVVSLNEISFHSSPQAPLPQLTGVLVKKLQKGEPMIISIPFDIKRISKRGEAVSCVR
jgi:hypothetical protein